MYSCSYQSLCTAVSLYKKYLHNFLLDKKKILNKILFMENSCLCTNT